MCFALRFDSALQASSISWVYVRIHQNCSEDRAGTGLIGEALFTNLRNQCVIDSFMFRNRKIQFRSCRETWRSVPATNNRSHIGFRRMTGRFDNRPSVALRSL